ncbi:MAG: hypothetical protein IJS36_03175 [Kiritimatiellae bacterium]|nr:hypothetical protein [Kiritimatiellia bacterium]
MLTLLIAIAAGCGGYCAAFYAGDWGVGWSITAGVVAFGVTQGVIGFLVQKRIKADMDRVQGILLEGQKRLQTKMQRWQFRPPGSQKDAQREIENDSRIFVREALAATECLSKYRWMVPMIGRQKATAQLQLNWMIKDFKAVDELLPKALFIDPTTSAIKIARMYMKDASVEEMEKVYRKSVRRLKYNQNVLLAAEWSWILLKRNGARDEGDSAFRALTEALKSSDNEVLKRNHELLMNKRLAHFSNSGLGDQWFALLLEEPRMRMQRQHVQRM